MNHVPARPLLAVFEVPNYMLNDLISFFCASALGANTSDIFNFLRINRFPLPIIEFGVSHAHWGILFLGGGCVSFACCG